MVIVKNLEKSLTFLPAPTIIAILSAVCEHKRYIKAIQIGWLFAFLEAKSCE